MWVKNRDTAYHWKVFHTGLNGGTNPEQYYLEEDDGDEADDNTIWNDSAPTSTHITLGNNDSVNKNGDDFIAMLFTSVDGISKCGFYDGSSSDVTVTTGFQPRFVIIKATNNSRGWTVMDTTRGWGSGVDNKIMLSDTAAQDNSWDYGAPTSTGFTVSHSQYDVNYTGWKYIYYAHA